MGSEILSKQGFEVLSVTDGAAVPEALTAFRPDLILVDVALPSMSGYQICERIKTDPDLERMKVVLLLGMSDPFDPAEAQRVGVDAILRKPLEPSAVIEVIRPLLGGPAPNPLEHAVEQALQDPGGEPDGHHRVDPTQVRGAVVLAVESALPGFLDELTRRVLEALRHAR